MKITGIEVFLVALPLVYPWRTAYGEDSEIHSVLVRLVSEGMEGWGESSPLEAPSYSPETAGSVFHIITNFIAPFLVGREFDSPEELLETTKWIKGNPFAKAGAEIAFWVLNAKSQDLPLHRLLGGESRPIQAGADFGIQDSIDMLLEKIQAAVDRGHPRVKLKVKHGWDLNMLRSVRKTFPSTVFHIDCNAGYSLDDLPFFKEVDKLGLAMIEQPLFHTDLHDHAKLQKMIETPICLDESIKSVRDFELALKLGSCRYLNIKPGRVGGLSAAIELHRLSQEAGIPCWAGGMLESGVGVGILIEMATLPNFTYPNDIVPSDFFYNPDMVNPLVVINEDCTFTPSNCPGIPYEPDLELLKSRTVSRRVFETK
jgi:o-succinylbenzoate synthase